VPAKTRSWKTAELFAQSERAKQDQVRLELQKIAEAEAVKEAAQQPLLKPLSDALIMVCHLPPGTSKWNKIEHRLFSFIPLNWRGNRFRSARRSYRHHRPRSERSSSVLAGCS
jgi:hypothetical protein